MQCKGQRYTINVNFASLVIGFLLGLCAMLAMGLSNNSDNNIGRYQCCAAGDDDFAVFVADTYNGQTWRLSRSDTYNFGTPMARKSIRQSETPLVK